jgi:hypothetical protein
VGLSFFAVIRIGAPWYAAPRRVTAVIASFALLSQAMLFAWHHHPHPLPLHELSTAGFVAVANDHPVPPLADNDCQICSALGHHSAAAVDFFATPLADHEPLPLLSAAAVYRLLSPYLFFRSRAPPRA